MQNSYNQIVPVSGRARKAFIFSRIIFALTCCSMLLIHADAKIPKGKPKPSPTPFHVTIESVSSRWITVAQPGGPKTYKITKDTEITFKSDTVTVHRLRTGMRVEVTPDAVNEKAAGFIQADDPPPAPPKKPSK